jgi:hypothetical protein
MVDVIAWKNETDNELAELLGLGDNDSQMDTNDTTNAREVDGVSRHIADLERYKSVPKPNITSLAVPKLEKSRYESRGHSVVDTPASRYQRPILEAKTRGEQAIPQV